MPLWERYNWGSGTSYNRFVRVELSIQASGSAADFSRRPKL